MNIVDKNGTWLVNRGEFPIVDPITNTRFEPAEPVKATHTAWLKSQPTIERTGDPTADTSEKEQAKLDELNAQDQAARDAAQIAADKVRADSLSAATKAAAVAASTPAA